MKVAMLEKKAQQKQSKPSAKLEEKIASLRAMVRLSGIPIEVKEVCSDWLLLTFDLPCNEEGNKMRRKFLYMAKAIGASQHTESVYLLPWTPESESAALDIASIGSAFLWTSNVKDLAKATALTHAYDVDIERRLDDLGERVDKVDQYVAIGRKRDASRMMEKTGRIMRELKEIVALRGSENLMARYETISERLLNAFNHNKTGVAGANKKTS